MVFKKGIMSEHCALFSHPAKEIYSIARPMECETRERL